MIKVYLLPIIVVTSGLLFGACTLPFGGPKYAGIQVNSEPKSAVYIDDKNVGETDYYDTKIKPANHIVRLSPLENTGDSWETKVKLLPGLTTVIKRTFGNTPQESSDYIIQLEKISNQKDSELTIVTTPENVIVRIDDQPKGFSPLNNIGITPDTHKITLSAPGYKTENISINPVLGYRLLLNAELGKSLSLQPSLANSVGTPSATPVSTPQATSSATPKPSPSLKSSPTPKPSTTSTLEKPFVEILTTPTGWLRVRSEPNGLIENEVAKVNSGDSFPFIETNDTGWYKIEYAKDKQGWIAATYAKLVK
jgi:hypothetical protein